MTRSLFEIEDEIHKICGVSVGPHYPKRTISPDYYWKIEGLVKEWLAGLGVPQSKIFNIGNGKQANLYLAGRNWVINNIVNGDDDTKTRRRAPRGFGTKADTSDISFGGESDLDDLLGLPKRGETQTLPKTKLEARTDSDAITITHDLLRSATNAVMEEKVNELRVQVDRAVKGKLADLDQEIRSKVQVEIAWERVEATNRAIKIATETAVQEALRATEDFITKRIPRVIEIRTPTETKRLDDAPRHKAFEEVIFNIACGMNVYMWGPRGTGKTHIMPQVCDAISRRYIPIGQSLSKYDVTGYTSPTGEYIKTHARDAMENGGILGVDEGDAWAAAALIALNTPLANRYCPFPDKIIQVHKDFQCILAANTTGFGATPEYQGRNPLDSTSTDRFVFVHVDYDEDLETQLFGNTPWVRYVHDVRTYVKTQLKQTAALPSMRPIEQGTKLLACGGDPEKVVKWVLWKALPQDMVNKIEANVGRFGRRDSEERDAAD